MNPEIPADIDSLVSGVANDAFFRASCDPIMVNVTNHAGEIVGSLGLDTRAFGYAMTMVESFLTDPMGIIAFPNPTGIDELQVAYNLALFRATYEALRVEGDQRLPSTPIPGNPNGDTPLPATYARLRNSIRQRYEQYASSWDILLPWLQSNTLDQGNSATVHLNLVILLGMANNYDVGLANADEEPGSGSGSGSCERKTAMRGALDPPPTCPDVSYNPTTCPYFGYLSADAAAQFIAALVSNPYMNYPYINETVLGLQTFDKIINNIQADPGKYDPSSQKNDLVKNIIDNIENLAKCVGTKKLDNRFWGIPWVRPITPAVPPVELEYNHFLSSIFLAVADKSHGAELQDILNWKPMVNPSPPSMSHANQNVYLNIASIRFWARRFSGSLTRILRYNYSSPNNCTNSILVNIPQNTQVINKNIINLVDQSIFPVNPNGSIKQTVCANLNDENIVKKRSFDASGKVVGVSCPPGLGMGLTGGCDVKCDCFGSSGETVCYSNDGNGSVCKPQIEEGCPTYNEMDSSGILHSYPYMATL